MSASGLSPYLGWEPSCFPFTAHQTALARVDRATRSTSSGVNLATGNCVVIQSCSAFGGGGGFGGNGGGGILGSGGLTGGVPFTLPFGAVKGVSAPAPCRCGGSPFAVVVGVLGLGTDLAGTSLSLGMALTGGVLFGGTSLSVGVPASESLELLSFEAFGGQAGKVGFARAAGPALPSLPFPSAGVFAFGGVTKGLRAGFGGVCRSWTTCMGDEVSSGRPAIFAGVPTPWGFFGGGPKDLGGNLLVVSRLFRPGCNLDSAGCDSLSGSLSPIAAMTSSGRLGLLRSLCFETCCRSLSFVAFGGGPPGPSELAGVAAPALPPLAFGTNCR